MKRNENTNEKKNLKKKILMVTGLALLLGLVGYTGGTTYAKYVTEKDVVTQTATVAQWGVVITADTNVEGFGSDYSDKLKVANDTGTGVSAIADNLVVAPGTEGEFNFSIAGTPEVSSKLTFDFADTLKDVHYGTYYPIVWKFVDGTNTFEGKLSEVAAEVEALTAEYAPETVLDKTCTLSWKWALEGQNDEFDTYLGNLAAGKSGDELVGTEASYSTEVSFKLTVSVEQTA